MDSVLKYILLFLLISAVACQEDEAEAVDVDNDGGEPAAGFGADVFSPEDLATDEPIPMERYEEQPPYGPYEPPKDPEPLPEPQYVPENPPPAYEKPAEPEYLPTKPPVYEKPAKPIKEEYKPVKEEYKPVKEEYKPVKEEYKPAKEEYKPAKEEYKPAEKPIKEPAKSPCAAAPAYGGCPHTTLICCAPIVCCLQLPTPAPYVPPKPVDVTRINWKALGRILLNPLIMPLNVASQAAMKGAAVPALGSVKGSLVSGALATPIIVTANAAGPLGSAAVGAKYGLPSFLMNGLGRVHPYFRFN